MKPLTVGPLLVLLGCATPSAPECGRFAVLVFEYRIRPDGVLDRFEFNQFSDRKSCNPISIDAVSDAWLKTACVTLPLTNDAPTYASGQDPQSRYIFRLFDPDRPDVIYPNSAAGSTEDNPVFYVRDEILDQQGKTRDGSTVCNQTQIRPPHNNPMQTDDPESRPPQAVPT